MQPNAVDNAIARCDAILANIDRIQRDLRESTAKAQRAIQETIDKLNNGVAK